ncbi:MAG: hypothetical protein ACREMJ_04595 [Gemmatimonadales bacterium]
MGDGGDAATWGVVNAGVGTVSLIFGFDAALRRPPTQFAARRGPAAASTAERGLKGPRFRF